MNVTTARELNVAPGVTAATRNPIAMWLLVFLTLGIGGVVWIYVVNRELRDYSKAVGRPFGNSPVVSAILAALWPVAFIPTLIAVWLTARRVRTAQQWTGTPGRVHPALAALLVFALFTHVWYLQHAPQRRVGGRRRRRGAGGGLRRGFRDRRAGRDANPRRRVRRVEPLPLREKEQNVTTSTAKQEQRLTNEQTAELLALTKGADSVELKLTVPEGDHRSAISALGIDPLDAQIRQVFFFDTPDLTLNDSGVVVRARRVQGKGDDTVVKLRPVVPDDLSGKLRKSPTFGVEVDAMPGGFVCSGSFKGVAEADVRKTVLKKRPLGNLFSKEQRAFYEQRAPEGVGLDDLTVLGPIFVLKLKFEPKGFGRPLVAEMWLYPDSSRILELSTKCAPSEAFQTAAEARAFLTERGVDLSGEQETKTRKALEYFSKVVAESAD